MNSLEEIKYTLPHTVAEKLEGLRTYFPPSTMGARSIRSCHTTVTCGPDEGLRHIASTLEPEAT